MADVFISHAAADSHLAEFLHRHLTQEGLSVYLASVSMPPGERWMPYHMNVKIARPRNSTMEFINRSIMYEMPCQLIQTPNVSS